ncbi:HAMP domain-containing protein [Cellulomonas sp. DKR-3]|uniref:histidine kinase n=1 Tax=Cellulomonas fulva TaxID=2835530 RepID=A0ABS5TW35_9CELL|nr:HAMP domain-containing protein [Cellulomonas fulva]MBT0993324.1 HAMP domain-containing protein [Cellulomonas fulva]
MLRRLGIRAKVLAVLAVPMLVLVLLGVYISATSISDLLGARATQQVTKTLRAYQPLGQAIDNEYVTSMTSGDPEAIAAAQAATDAALADVREFTNDLDLSRFPDALVQQFQSVQADYEVTLPAARLAVERGGVNSVVRANFQTIERDQLELVGQLGETFQNRELATAVNSYLMLSTTSTELVAEMIDGLSMLSGTTSPTIGDSYAAQVQSVETARTDAAVALNRVSGVTLSLPPNQPSSAFIAMRTLLSDGTSESVSQVDPAAYLGEIETQIGQLVDLAGQSIDEAQRLADIDADAALNRTYVTIGATVLAAVASFLLALVVARSIVGPLRRLTSAASDVRERLPQIVEQVATPGEQPDVQLDPIPVNSRDEVGRLAQAFNSMNATTVRVAQEQAALRGSIAEMFVNVARRDQVLLNRQLSFIDSLERTEEDPNTLANLFRLDHLATRMRRNAESLLVLAGIDSGRRLRDAMPLSDVVRTASSEIEQYDRIELDLQVDPPMLGFNALPAAHLLAELLENATVFSEPETPVTVTTGVSGQFVAIRIRDHGLGMTDDEIAAANAKIAASAAGDVLGAQRLGLFVVGRIAQKLGAAVRIAKAAGGTGTDTTVLLPATLFASGETAMYGAPSVAVELERDAAEAPVAAEVDLAALTDGETSLGLPRRRRGEGEADAESGAIPVTPAGLPTRGELPARPKKTFDEDNIVLPVATATNLSPDLSTAAPDWTPAALESTGGGLPTRNARTSAWQPPADEPTTTSSAPASPAARAGLFSGFRGRTAADQSAVPGLAPDGDGGDRAADQVRAPWMSLGAHGAAPEPIVVPGLADDDDETWSTDQPVEAAPTAAFEADTYQPSSFEQGAPLVASEPGRDEQRADEQPADEQPADEHLAEQPADEPAVDEHPAAEEAWAPTFAEPEAAQHEPVADEQVSAEPAAYEPAAYEPAPFGSAPYEPAPFEPAAYEPAPFEPAADEATPYEPVALRHDETASDELGSDEHAYVPQPEAAAGALPVRGWSQEPQQETVPEHASFDDGPAFDALPPVDATWADAVDAEATHDEPAHDEAAHDEAAHDEAAHDEPVQQPVSPWASFRRVTEPEPQDVAQDAAPAHEAVADAYAAQPSVEQPAEHDAYGTGVDEPVVAPSAPVAPVAYTAYSGYAGWAASPQGPADSAAPFDFERTLDEARAWHTGAQPTVEEAPAAYAPVVEEAPAEPAAEADTVAYEPVAYEPVAETPVAEAPVAEEPASSWDGQWQAPTWEAPRWDAPTETVEPIVEPLLEQEPEAYVAPVEDAPEQLAVPALADDERDQDADAAVPVWADTTPAWSAPTWPSLADDEPAAEPAAQPVEQAPVEQAPVEQVPVAQTPVAQPAPVAEAPQAPAEPAWAPTAPAAPVAAAAGFGATGVAEASRDEATEQDRPRKRWGLFGRRKGSEAEEAPAAASFAPEPAAAPQPAAEPVRTSAWSAPSEPVAPAPVEQAWSAPQWNAPEAPAPSSPEPAPAAWAPPEWAARPAAPAAPAAVDVPNPVLPPSVAPRIGTLDDDVAAMLALRSDIQEQALSELSQLSAYRPAANTSGERLTRRVPTAIPQTAPEQADGAPVQRDASELRSRLSSFQSGTSRGRQAAGTPNDGTSHS